MISVIIPTYKSPEYLDLCLKSAFLGQQNKNEIIVVVDGFYELNKEVLSKYPETNVLNLETNQGLSVATNWGVYNSSNDYILVVNDDNVFPNDWDVELEKYLQKRRVITPNQIEPNPSMFRQFHIKDLGKHIDEFNLQKFWKYEEQIEKQEPDKTGSTLPFAMHRLDYLAIGGWDVMYPSPHVVDWDFFAKCEYHNFEMIRVYKHFYHFAGKSTRSNKEQNELSNKKERYAHQFFKQKWGIYAEHNPQTNSKKLHIF